MDVRLSRTEDRRTVAALHTLIFPDDEEDLDGQLWVGHDNTNTPVAFCSARKLKSENAVFFSRAGVLPCAAGHGLQRRMINARIRWAREQDADFCITYTVHDNHASIVNLLRCGFRFYRPAHLWAGRVHYFWRDL